MKVCIRTLQNTYFVRSEIGESIGRPEVFFMKEIIGKLFYIKNEPYISVVIENGTDPWTGKKIYQNVVRKAKKINNYDHTCIIRVKKDIVVGFH